MPSAVTTKGDHAHRPGEVDAIDHQHRRLEPSEIAGEESVEGVPRAGTNRRDTADFDVEVALARARSPIGSAARVKLRVRRRPFLVMTRTAVIPVLHSVLAAPVTRTIRDIPTEPRLGESDGMPMECVASFDNLRVVAKAYLVERQSTLDPMRLTEACGALQAAVDCFRSGASTEQVIGGETYGQSSNSASAT